ncbi:MAG TPA: phosphoribosyltransferase family protein [Candidatus Nanopelagicales bacterium]|nr:phosphoribosyltransferase family protein [Candidatus Nanopelagicales bacterium]
MSLFDDVRPCAGCRGPAGPICARCGHAFRAPAFRVDRPGTLALPVVASATYDGPVREALIAFKDHGRWSLRDVLGASLGHALSRLLAGRLEQRREPAELPPLGGLEVPDLSAFPAAPRAVRFLLVPVPSTRASVRARDGDHVTELAERAEERLPRLVLHTVPGLMVVRRRHDQVGLGRAERAANLAGSMRATDTLLRRASPPGTGVVLIDDIVTTGATLAEAHRALLAAGIHPWGAAVVAATPDLPRRGVPGSGHRVR